MHAEPDNAQTDDDKEMSFLEHLIEEDVVDLDIMGRESVMQE